MSNALDRIIGYFAPQAAARRVAARNWMRVHAAYEGAKTGRRTAGWLTSSNSANAEISASLASLRERSRQMIRDNYLSASAVGAWSDAVVGPGILCRWKDQRVQDLWDAWTPRCTAEGWSFEAMQDQACTSVFESGEVLIRIRMREPQDGITPPFQIQLLESDYLDHGKTQTTETGYIVQGVEFDKVGRRIAYWLYGQHPGEVVNTGVRSGLSLASASVPASSVIHLYRATRPGQTRGVPALHPVILSGRDMADWLDAELLRKKTEGCIVGAITSPEAEDYAFGTEVLDVSGNPVTEIQPGMLMKTKPGESVEIKTPNYAGGFGEAVSSFERMFSAGVRMPFELITGNYSLANYSSSRMGAVAFKRHVEGYQWKIFIPVFCEGVAAQFVKLAKLAGGRNWDFAHEWHPPAFDLLDRLNEAEADEIELRTGAATWDQVVSRRGQDPNKQMQEILKRKPELDQAGIAPSSTKQPSPIKPQEPKK